MKTKGITRLLILCCMMINGCSKPTDVEWTVYETSAGGHQFAKLELHEMDNVDVRIQLDRHQMYQTITGFGGAFTEASAYLLNRLSPEKREMILDAYFGEEGARYSLTRTHMNSCDFSLRHYSYAPVANDMALEHFSIEEDKDDLIPMIKSAMDISKDGFKILASPWTAPPWMKDNQHWVGGRLDTKYYDTWAHFYAKYLEAYQQEGIDIWGFTVVNEPHGNGDNWESMLFTPEEMTQFVQNHLGPRLEADGYGNKVILGYDQNREGIQEWVDTMYATEASAKYYHGTAIHWYESTYEVFPEALQYAHNKAPNKYLIQTEACVDAEVPKWKNDAWYWSKVATDWGWDWAPEHQKHLHPKYVPVYRYARDIIGCLNNWVDGWIDWNMVLDTQGGPNWANNWCVAPVIVNPDSDEVYFTPIYYTLMHFSKFMRPGAKVIESVVSDSDLQVAAVENTYSSIVVVVFNEGMTKKRISLSLDGEEQRIEISPQAIQTVVIARGED